MRRTLFLLATFATTTYIILTQNVYTAWFAWPILFAFVASGVLLGYKFNKWMEGKQKKDEWVPSRDIRTRR